MAALILFVSYSIIVFLGGYHWRKVSAETAGHDSQAIRMSLLEKI